MKDNKLKVKERRHIGVAVVMGALIALSVAALLFNFSGTLAQSIHPAQDVSHEPARATRQLDQKGVETMGQASDSQIKFENPADAPLIIREVKVKRASGANATDSSTISVTVVNTTSRQIASFGLVFVQGSKEKAYTERSEVIEPNGTYGFDALTLAGKTSELVAKIKGVRFADGSKWGEFSPAPPPPPAPKPPAN